MAWSAGQRYVAEFVGTFLLLAAVTTAAVVSGISGTSFATINAPTLLISLAIGLALAAGIYALGDVSGGHFNPAVTIAMALGRRTPWRDVVPYIVAQVLGGFAGVLATGAVLNGWAPAWTRLVSISFASQGYAGGNSPYPFAYASVLLFEIVVTFLFIFVILRVTRPESGAKNLAPLAIGLTLAMANLIGIAIDGASFNPARSFAPALVSAIWPPAGGEFAIQQSWMFWVAPIVGGVLAALVDRYFRAPSGGPSSPTEPPAGAT